MNNLPTILYIGNDLTGNSKYHSAYQTLKLSLRKEGIKVYNASNKEHQLIRLIDMLLHIIKYQKKVEYVLIDTFSTSAFYYAYLCSQFCRLFKLKFIPILHGGNLPKRLKVSPYFSKQIFKNSYENIAPSKYLLQSFLNEGFETRLIENSIETSKIKFTQRNKIKPKLLYARAFAEIYNPYMAIEVFNRIVEKYPEAKLCMVGPDKDGTRAKIEKLIKKNNLEEKVLLTGVLPREEWHELSEKYDIFINTTNVDNTPVSLIETWALGLPIISTNAGGIPFMVEDKENALLVDKNDVMGMERAIVTLLENPTTTEKLSLNGRSEAESYNWDVVKQKWFKVLQ